MEEILGHIGKKVLEGIIKEILERTLKTSTINSGRRESEPEKPQQGYSRRNFGQIWEKSSEGIQRETTLEAYR